MNDMNPFQIMVKTLVKNIDLSSEEVVLHSTLRSIVIAQVVTSRMHDYVTIISTANDICVFHLGLINSFPLEVRSKNDQSDPSPDKRIGFQHPVPNAGEDVTQF